MSDIPSSPALPLRRQRNDSAGMGLSISPNTLTVLNNGDSGPLYSNPQSPIDSQIRIPPSEPSPSGRRNFSGSYVVGDDNDEFQLGGNANDDDDDDDDVVNAGEAAGAAGAAGGGGSGLGNLADELAEAWEEDEENENDENGQNGGRGDRPSLADVDESSYIDSLQHLGPGPSTAEESGSVAGGLASPTRGKLGAGGARGFGHAHLQGHGHRKNDSQRSLYDGSDYGNDSDFEESSDLSPVLEQRLAAIDNLVRLSMAESRAGGDQVIERMIDGLRDLGGQSKVETSATRLITAHSAITSHLKHQTRTLQNLIHPLLYTHFPTLSIDAIEDLLTLIEDLIPMLPFPTPIPNTIDPSSLPHPPHLILPHQQPTDLSSSSPPLDPSDPTEQPLPPPPLPPPEDLSDPEVLANTTTTTTDPLISLQALLAQTSDITHALRFISDTIHESRQLTSVASRRLKNVRELVADIRREEVSREEGTRFIEKGNWDRRLSDREAGKECRDVVSGFEEVCGVWRERLFGGAEAVAT